MKQEKKLATIIKKNISNPLLFLGVARMEKYEGGGDGDKPQGNARHIKKNGECGEMWNFKQEKKYYCGYGMTPYSAGVDLKKVVGGKNWQKEDEAGNIDVVFLATRPRGGANIVGWYKNATVLHKHYDKKVREKYGHLCWTEVGNEFLVDVEDRETLPKELLPRGIPQSQIMYLDKKPELAEYLRNYIDNNQTKVRTRAFRKNACIDQEEKRKIESNAVDAATKHYESKGYKVESFEKENCGWDLKVTKQGEKDLRVEVKGHKGGDFNFELTHNEYRNMKKDSKTYRVFVARKALSDNPKTTIFSPYKEKGKWCLRDEKGKKLPLDEKTSAHAKPAG